MSWRTFPDCSFSPTRLWRWFELGAAARTCNLMMLDIARLFLFPGLMAFAAASDLLTMTISNRVSVALAAGFLIMSLLSGMGVHDILSHLAAGAAVLVVSFA